MFKKTIYIFIFLIIHFTSLFAYDIEYRNDGFDLRFDNIEYEINEDILHNFSIIPTFNNFGVLNSDSPYSIGEIRILFAVPHQSEITYRIISFTEEVVLGKLAKKETTAKEEKLDYNISIEKAGNQRGVMIYSLRIIPLKYNPSENHFSKLKKINLSIEYGTTINEISNSSYESEISQFINVVNIEHIKFLLSQVRSTKKNKNRLLNVGWYDPTKEYARLGTTQDGIAYIPVSELMSVLPTISSGAPEFLHLVFYGDEYPLKYLDNGNNLIDNEDTLYFFGRRPFGDTTWTDHYSDSAAFYLYYDESVNGMRFSDFPEVNFVSGIIDDIEIYHHIEKERTYHRGFPQESSETQPGEGWFWDVISPSFGWTDAVIDTILILPSSANNDIHLTLQFASCKWNPYKEELPAHTLQATINDLFPKIKSYAVRARDSLVYQITTGNYFKGLNVFKIKSLPVYDLENNLIEPNQIGIDYYTLKFNSKPYSLNGKSEFHISALNENSKLSIPGFNDKQIWYVDTLNRFMSHIEGVSGAFTVLNADYEKSFASVYINDSYVFVEQKRGLFIAYLNSGEINSSYFSQAGSEAVDYLNSIPTNSLITAVFNGQEKPVNGFISFFTQYGSQEVNKISGGDQWVFSGYENDYIENYDNSSFASVSGSLNNSNGQNFKASINLPAGYNSNLVFNDNDYIEKAQLSSVHTTLLHNEDNKADLLVITHKKFFNSANEYKKYREKTHENLNIEIIDVQDIYKEFNYGRKSVASIKEFFKYALYNWKEPKLKYILFWGDGSWDVRKILPGSINEDYIPSYGWPSSDYWFATLDDDPMPELQIGRIPINTDLQGLDYIDKLIVYDSIDNKPWMKKFFMLTGGQEQVEIDHFYNFGKYVYNEDNIANTNLCADTLIISKAVPSKTTESLGGQIQGVINEGISWLYFMGHGSARVFDMDGWQVQKLNNKNKYGFMSTLSCNTAAFAEPNLVTRNEEYMLEKDKGFVGTGGSSGVTFVTQALNLGLLMLQSLSLEKPAESYLDALWYAKSRLIYSIEDKLTTAHYTYLGDPLLKLKIQKYADFYMIKKNINIKNTAGESLLTISDSVKITGELYNLGHRYFKEIDVLLIHEYKAEKDTLKKIFYGLCYPGSLEFIVDVVNKPGRHKFTILIDPEHKTDDTNLQNNQYTFFREVFNKGVYPVEPLPNWNVDYAGPKFRVVNPLETGNIFKYKFRIFSTSDTGTIPIAKSEDSEIFIYSDYIDWNPTIELEKMKNYWLALYTIKLEDSTFTPLQLIPFNTYNVQTTETAVFTIDKSFNFGQFGENNNTVLIYNQEYEGIYLKQEEVPYSILSIFGSKNTPERDAEIRFDGKVYISVPPDILGFKVVAVSSDSLKPYAVRNYNTYDNYENAEEFVRFIKDTVNEKDYILLATNGESFRAFRHLKYTKPESIGSLDSLTFYLKNYYGSKLSDTLDENIGSYSLIGRKNFQFDSTREVLDYNGDTAKIEGNITRFYQSGNYISKAIGPVKKWKSIELSSAIGDSASIIMTIFGINDKKGTDDSLFALSLNNGITYKDISSIDENVYRQIYLRFNFNRINEEIKPILYSIKLHYIPAPELALSSEKSNIAKDTILRGENLNINLNVKNLSLRSSSPETSTLVRIESETKLISELSIIVPELAVNSEIDLKIIDQSDHYDLKNSISCILNYKGIVPEQYLFNNKAKFLQYLKEDTEKPSIEFKLDGMIVEEGDYVSRVPYIEIILLDNSPLEIENVKHIRLGINRPFPGNYDTLFTSYGRNKPEKAKLAFYSDTLDFGENYFRIFVSDLAGNKDTLLRKVNVSLNGYIEDLSVYPNPFNNLVNIKFSLKAPNNDGMLYIEIYNQMGQKIREIIKTTQVGTNLFEWDGRDDYNIIQPSGFYTFIIRSNSTTYIEPKTGKMIFIR